MVILLLINIAIIIYVYLKYYRLPKNVEFTNDKIEDLDSMIIGYINDQGIDNNFDLLLSGIIELNIKGYIKIEYDKKETDKYNYIIKQNIDMGSDEINKYEILVLSFLFAKGPKITKLELEEKLKNTFNSYNVQYNEIRNVLNKEVIYQGIIDENKQKKYINETKKYIKISIISVIIVLILGALNVLDISLLYISMYILEKIVVAMLISKSSIYTKDGQNLKYSIDSYKICIENKEFLENKSSMQDIVLNKEFANSLALHINTEAKKAFIDDIMSENATKVSKKYILNILIVAIVLLLIGIIILKITKMLSVPGFFWVYLILAISGACVFDIAHSLGRGKK